MDGEEQEFENWLRRWAVALRQRGDERSLAAVDFLESLPWRKDAAQRGPALQSLHRRARLSGDGFVVALANSQACTAELGCSEAMPRDRWAQLEPGNLSAWLALAPAGLPVSEAWLSGLLQSTYDNSHRRELMGMLLSLPPQLPPGPRRLARDIGLIGINSGLNMLQFRPLISHCRGGADAQRCRAIAEKLWALREPELINWMLTLALARTTPPVDPAWEPRARQTEAAQQWLGTVGVQNGVDAMLQSYQCKPDPTFERWTRGLLIDGEGAMLLADMKTRGVDMGSLSAEYRRQSGRNLLHPSQSRASAASAANR